MFTYIIFLSVLSLVTAGKSPNGEEYISLLSPEELRTIPDDIIEDALLDVPDLITKYGYPVETHEVQTEDGYILTMHRIPYGKNGKSDGNRIPVFLQHGVTGTSSHWVYNRPERSLAYILADDGYDVWMGNSRGNYYSRKHVELDPESRRFWTFTWNELGYYDLPASIDYILENTGYEKLHYVGHSQGTTIFFVMGSTRPEYNDKIIAMQALAPAAYMSNLKNPYVQRLSKYGDYLQIIITALGFNEFLWKADIRLNLVLKHCGNESSELYQLCTDLVFTGVSEQTNATMKPVYMGHQPAGASSRQLAHYAQLIESAHFRQYDRGFLGNIAYYGRLTPPKYPLRRLTAPVALHYSLNDDLVEPIDVFKLESELGNPIGLFEVPWDLFTHGHFITAIDVRSLLYDRVMEIMKSFE